MIHEIYGKKNASDWNQNYSVHLQHGNCLDLFLQLPHPFQRRCHLFSDVLQIHRFAFRVIRSYCRRHCQAYEFDFVYLLLLPVARRCWDSNFRFRRSRCQNHPRRVPFARCSALVWPCSFHLEKYFYHLFAIFIFYSWYFGIDIAGTSLCPRLSSDEN